MKNRWITAVLLWVSTPITSLAYSPGRLNVRDWGINNSSQLTVQQIVGNIVSVGTGSIYVLCSSIFIIGALLFAISAGDEKRKSLGKDLMIGAVIGIGVVVGARGILNLVYFFLYGSL